jgi:putative lipoprotein
MRGLPGFVVIVAVVLAGCSRGTPPSDTRQAGDTASAVSPKEPGRADTAIGGRAPDTPIGSAAPDTANDPLAALWAEARRRGAEYRALGQEPGWSLEIDEQGPMHLVADYGDREVTLPAPVPERAADGTVTYRASDAAHRLTVVIQPDSCWDAMSGFPFPHTVTVTLDSLVYHGCGRRL